MKKITTLLSILCLAIIPLCSSCSEDPVDTVYLSMRNSNNGKTYLDNIYIHNENFTGYGCTFVDIGSVHGLGDVDYIPKSGWADQVSVMPGHGYVAYDEYAEIYYRIYVIADIESTSGGIIGADIKYQKPFIPE